MNLTRRKVLGLIGAGAGASTFTLKNFSFAQTTIADAPYKQAHLPVEDRVRDLLSRMTIEEKARQLDMYAGVTPETQTSTISSVGIIKTTGFRASEAEALWGKLGVGSIHDLHPSPELYNTIQNWIVRESRLGIPAIFVEEGLHGYFDGTIFPSPIGLGATWNPALAKATAEAIAAEARANGVALLLCPVLDVARDPRWGRVEEGFGEDPYLNGQFGLAFTLGAQGESLNSDHTVVSEPKHFAGHGTPESGTNSSTLHAGEREVRSVMLKSFEPAIRDGHAMGVMAAYHEIDGVPVTADPHLLIDILRDEWGFKGFVLSDLGAIRRLYGKHFVAATPKDAVCLSINSGMDMQFYDFEHKVFQDAIVSGAADGTLQSAALDRAVSAVLRVKFMLGLFDRPMVDPKLSPTVSRKKAHLDLSLESARQSMTLLRNEGNLLPLAKTLQRIAVVGINANAARYGDYSEESKGARVNMLDALKSYLPNAAITFDVGKDIAAAVNSTKDAEVIIAGLGERRGISGESKDRSILDLPENQQPLLEALVATGKPVVLVLQNGRPLTIGWAAKHVPAILEAWYPAEFGGTAIVETLFGDNNPAGRLTITFPKSVGQLPMYYNYAPAKKIGYIDNDGLPLYPFGFGLSYTSFQYADLVAQTGVGDSEPAVSIHVEVTNVGKVAGDEVVQLYYRQAVASVTTPVKSLAGFQRIHLKPGQKQKVSFSLSRKDLAIWGVHKRWAFEPGDFTVWVGGSSEAPLNAKFMLKA